MSKVNRIKFSIPIGAVISIITFIYLITEGVWNKLSMSLKFLAVIGLILLFLLGEVKYERQETTKE